MVVGGPNPVSTRQPLVHQGRGVASRNPFRLEVLSEFEVLEERKWSVGRCQDGRFVSLNSVRFLTLRCD